MYYTGIYTFYKDTMMIEILLFVSNCVVCMINDTMNSVCFERVFSSFCSEDFYLGV